MDKRTLKKKITKAIVAHYPKETEWLLGIGITEQHRDRGRYEEWISVTIMASPRRDRKVLDILKENFPEYDFHYAGGVGQGGWRILSGILIFDPITPRIVSIEHIMRDKKKPYTVFSHCLIIRGDDIQGIPTEVLQTDMSWKKLNKNPLEMTPDEAKKILNSIE